MNDLYADIPPISSCESLAELVGCHPESIRHAIQSGELVSVKIGRLVRIPRHQVIAWLTKNDDPNADNAEAVSMSTAPAHVSE